MKNIETTINKITGITSEQLFGVLATSRDNHPYTTLLAFHLSEDLKNLYFATPKDTRKFRELSSNPAVSFFIHNSCNLSEDLSQALGITITGEASELSKDRDDPGLNIFLEKHPQMKKFIFWENTAFIRVKVKRLDIVERFQNVTVLEIKE